MMGMRCIRSLDRVRLTWADTFEDLYPYPDSTIGMQPMLFRILYQSSMPSCAFLGERSNFVVFCKWSNQPIVRPRLKRRRRYGKWIQVFFGLGRSVKETIILVSIGCFHVARTFCIFIESCRNYCSIDSWVFFKISNRLLLKLVNWQQKEREKANNNKNWKFTHSWPYESAKSLTAFESHDSRIPNNFPGKNPFSAMITKYTKNPAAAWIIPICPYAMEINLRFMNICVEFDGEKEIKKDSKKTEPKKNILR